MNTEFIARSVKKNVGKTLAAGGTGLSAAAVIFIYTQFATKAELNDAKDQIAAQQQEVQKLNQQISNLQGRLEVLRLTGQ